jgi:uncharacterized protein (DUF111 family)
MGTTAWIDASVGVAGDMLLAALLDAGADADAVEAGLRRLDLPDVWRMRVGDVRRGAFRARAVSFDTAQHRHDLHGHEHGAWAEIRERLRTAPMPDRARSRALAAYERLARVEAELHGVAVALALDLLGVDEIVATPLPLGTGRVSSAHGPLPLPAPATLRLCVGWPVVPSPWEGEWVTPTGAALVTALARPGALPAGTPRAVGTGAGGRNPPFVANVVRVALVDTSSSIPSPEGADAVELCCNLDDATGQLVGAVIADLLAHGACDAWAVPLVMKKGRPGVALTVLAAPSDADRLSERMLRSTPTLGVRRHAVARDVLDRWHREVETPFGTVRVKVGGRDGVTWHATPEFDDVARRAEAAGVPVMDVWTAAVAAHGIGENG